MASIVVSGDTSGTITLSAPAVSGANTATLPAQTGTIGMIGQGTAVATTSGTAVDFTGIPSWVKQITVMLNGVSTSATSNLQVQIGSGSVTVTGYASAASLNATNVTATTGSVITANVAATSSFNGIVTIALLNSSSFIWAFSSGIASAAGTVGAHIGGGGVTLSGVLDRVRITTVNGTDTFDAGSVNILYQG